MITMVIDYKLGKHISVFPLSLSPCGALCDGGNDDGGDDDGGDDDGGNDSDFKVLVVVRLTTRQWRVMEEQTYSNKFVCFAFPHGEVILTFHQIDLVEKSFTHYASIIQWLMNGGWAFMYSLLNV